MDYKIITQEQYPDKLKNIKKMPKCLYVAGNIDLLYEDSFGIVGTRNPTEYGIRICKKFSKEFALRDIPIVSGMARGIDKTSHETSLENHSKTIGVLGCGLEYYLKWGENKELFLEIIKKGGLILSEYDLHVENVKENFPQRNRIISSLSEGILIVEAAFRSGSSITAKYARRYGKPVFAIPGGIDKKLSVGTNNLIKKGAIFTTDIGDILEYYPQFANRMRKTITKKVEKPLKRDIKEEWLEVMKILEEESCGIEELGMKYKKDIRVLMKLLCEMEIEGLIEQEIGIGYKLKKSGDI